jgi:hypothetical protein
MYVIITLANQSAQDGTRDKGQYKNYINKNVLEKISALLRAFAWS